MKLLANQLFAYPVITNAIYDKMSGSPSRLMYLDRFSEQQKTYIMNPSKCNVRLVACAGSGKTRSIIGRIRFMVEHRMVKLENIYAVTFSRHAAADFHTKIQELFPDYQDFCRLNNFSTIDSLAKSILCRVKSHKSENVEILSIAFRNYLRDMDDEQAEYIKSIKHIQHLFVDEAQDLNEVQYDLICLLQQRFSTTCELIGDPNQNIYQFRRSSNRFLMHFSGRQYELSVNYRSTQQIIDFSSALRPIQVSPCLSATSKTGQPVAVLTQPASTLHATIVKFIKMYSLEHDVNNIAIICPTRGIKWPGLGLSVFFNLLKISGIQFIQYYDESGSSKSENQKKVVRKPGHVNLLTYHGTKGMEFDVVFVMDFYQNLLNIKPTQDEHDISRYLLYVATSRAISLMYVCTYIEQHGGYLNHWLLTVAEQAPHSIASHGDLRIPTLNFRKQDIEIDVECAITEIIAKLSDVELNEIHDMIVFHENCDAFTRRIYQNHSDIDRDKNECLFGTFCEELFYWQYLLARLRQPREYPVIDNIINSRFVIVENREDKNSIAKCIRDFNIKTWEDFDSQLGYFKENAQLRHVAHLISTKFSRECQIEEYVVCDNLFIDIINMNINDIRESYLRYLRPDSYDWDYRRNINDFFYLIVVMYAYHNNHYYYMMDHAADKQELLQQGTQLYEDMMKYVSFNYLGCELDIHVNVIYRPMFLMGEIDFIEKYDNDIETLVDIKCVKEISIKHQLQLIMYGFCRYTKMNQMNKIYCNGYRILNLLTGLEHSFIASITPKNMWKLLTIFARAGGLKFHGLNLVYDLETTNRIITQGPFQNHPGPNIPRGIIKGVPGKYFVDVYPEIIEIAIRDYDTNMIVLDTLVKPSGVISCESQKITGITNEMICDAPTLQQLREQMNEITKKFNNCRLLAHNGSGFDDRIVLYDKLFDRQNVTFMDTMSLIPIHIPDDEYAISKSLVQLYKQIVGGNFPAHRALSDVDAICAIMRKLNITF